MSGCSLIQCSGHDVLPVRYRRGQVPEWAEEGKKTEKKKSHELRKPIWDFHIPLYIYISHYIYPRTDSSGET